MSGDCLSHLGLWQTVWFLREVRVRACFEQVFVGAFTVWSCSGLGVVAGFRGLAL